jgi:maltose/maltodextrin transport system permease protein
VLCTGLIKSIPADLYEASAIAGAKPLTNFFRITAPLIVKPLTPLLISAFAFNFNNFVLISLLTDGRPDYLNTKLPAGTTDILVSYTYRIAFTDAGANFGLAAAISTVIFFLVAILSLVNLKVDPVQRLRTQRRALAMAVVTGKSQRWRITLAHVGLWVLIAITLFPLLAVVSISLRPGNFATGSLIPSEISLEHWKLALGFSHTQADGVLVQPPFPVLLWLWNSIKIATISSLLIVGVSTTAAYGFARLRFRFKSTILNSMLLLQMFPVAVALVAIYAIFEAIGGVVPWLGIETHGGLIVAYIGGVAMHIWTIKGYFETIPTEIEECAKVDGATSWQAFYKVLLPMAVPILMVVFVLAFIGTIIEYPIASVLLREEPNLTLAVGSKYYLYEQRYLWGDFAAAAVLSGLPITLVFLAAQRWIVSGLTSGGVKG